MAGMRIGITDCGRFDNYAGWIKQEPHTTVLKLSYKDNSLPDIAGCDGIVLTGGQDVHPRYYGKMEYMDFYKGTIPDIDEQRDAFEMKVLDHAMQAGLPLLGICRGLQLANVFFGGTLVLDIPSLDKQDHAKIREGLDRYHKILITPGSALETITEKATGFVNSAHHQSALVVADNLVINALSEDGVIEGLERKDFYRHPYLLLVQWHPERMTEQQDIFSFNIKRSFLDAVHKTMHAGKTQTA